VQVSLNAIIVKDPAANKKQVSLGNFNESSFYNDSLTTIYSA